MNGSKKNHTSLIVGVLVCALVVIFWIVLIFYNVKKLKKDGVVEAWELDIGPHRFSYEELKKQQRVLETKSFLGLVDLVEFTKELCQIQIPKLQ